MSIFKIVRQAVSTLTAVGGPSPGVIAFAVSVLGSLIDHISSIVEAGGEMSLVDIEEFWEGFDRRTGMEGVIDLLPGVPVEDQELLLDGVKGIGLVLMRWAFGHYGDRPTAEQTRALAQAFQSDINAGGGNPDNGAAPDAAPGSEAAPEAAPASEAVVESPDVFDCLERSLTAPGRHLMEDRVRLLTKAVLMLRDRVPEAA